MLETDPVVPTHAPVFDAELVWEADKRRFRRYVLHYLIFNRYIKFRRKVSLRAEADVYRLLIIFLFGYIYGIYVVFL